MSKKHQNSHQETDLSVPTEKKPAKTTTEPSGSVTGDSPPKKPKIRILIPVVAVEKQPTWQMLAEILLIFAIFFAYGAKPTPDTNEPYYIGKAIHVWHPDTFKNDMFMNSHDTHWLFYQTFGWLSLFCSITVCTWVGRCALWLAIAWGWYRLSRAVIPVPWFSIISANAFVFFTLQYHMAGEWVIGGIEGKVFAYVFVFFGLDSLARNRWGLVWPFLGIAAAYHPVVGGWAVLATMIAWLMQRSCDRMPLIRMLIPLAIGGVLALPGVIPAIFIDSGIDKEVIAQAHRIAVFERLGHHLVPFDFAWSFIPRFCLLTMAWFCCAAIVWGRKPFDRELFELYKEDLFTSEHPETVQRPELTASPGYRISCFIFGTILITSCGFLITYGFRGNEQRLADLLRFYWFRMSDFSVPMGMALCCASMLRWGVRHCFEQSFPKELAWWGKQLVIISVFFLTIYILSFDLFYRIPKMLHAQLIEWGKDSEYYASLARQFPETPITRDAALAFGMVMLGGAVLVFLWRRFQLNPEKPELNQRRAVFAVFAITLFMFGGSIPFLISNIKMRLVQTVPRTAMSPVIRFESEWQEICRWIADPKNTPEDAVFLVPRSAESFKWFANRSDVGVWKEMPQDSATMVKWFETMNDCFALKSLTKEAARDDRWKVGLALLLKYKPEKELDELQKKYNFDYVLAESDPPLNLPVVYKTNKYYTLYRVGSKTEMLENMPSVPNIPNQEMIPVPSLIQPSVYPEIIPTNTPIFPTS